MSHEALAETGESQDHHADLDVRPPDHPGRPVRRVPAPACTSCCSARTASTTRSSARCASRTSRCAGCPTSGSRHEGQIDKEARVIELINAYRHNGHLMADTDPLEFKVRTHPDLDIIRARPDAVGPRPRVPRRRLRRRAADAAARHPRRAARRLLPHASASSTCTSPTPRSAGGSSSGSRSSTTSPTARSRSTSSAGSTPPRRSRRSCRPSTSARSGSASRAASRSSRCWTRCSSQAADHGLDEVVIGMPHRGRLNVLANIVGKPYGKIFGEFEGNIDPGTVQGSGDVKYHLGAERHVHTRRTGATIAVSLTANPSPPRGGRPGARGHRAGQAGHDRQGRGRLHRAAGPACTATPRSPARAWSPRR